MKLKSIPDLQPLSSSKRLLTFSDLRERESETQTRILSKGGCIQPKSSFLLLLFLCPLQDKKKTFSILSLFFLSRVSCFRRLQRRQKTLRSSFSFVVFSFLLLAKDSEKKGLNAWRKVSIVCAQHSVRIKKARTNTFQLSYFSQRNKYVSDSYEYECTLFSQCALFYS